MARHLPPEVTPITKSKHTAMLVYAHPGTGKTRLIGTTTDRTLIVRPPTDHVDSIRKTTAHQRVVSDWSDMDDTKMYLRENGADWDWVWLDSISLFQEVGLDDVFEKVVEKKPHRKGGPVDQGEYGVNMRQLAEWVRHVVKADLFNFGITAHPLENSYPLKPYVQGKNMSESIMGYMHIVAFYDIDANGRRYLRVRATDDYVAKDQLDAFPNGRLQNPTMDKINAALRKAKPAVRPSQKARSKQPERASQRTRRKRPVRAS